jgi:hypothetical protein
MTTKSNIEKICNYSEDTKNPYQPTISLNYIDMITEDEDAKLRELKRENRELAIDIILDEKDESEWENRNNLPMTDELYTTTISPKMFSVNTRAQKFTSFEDLEYEVFSKLETLTKNVPTSKSLLNNTLNLTIPTDNNLDSFESFKRSVLTKITMCGNFVAMESGKGIANSVIVGTNAIQYIEEYKQMGSILGGMNLIVSNYIDPDKVIVMRTENTPGVGLNVILKPNDLMYYMVETPQSWEKTMKWFWIK